MPVADLEHGSVPLITLNRSRNYQRLDDDPFDADTAYPGDHHQPSTQKMDRGPLQSMREARKGATKSGIAILSSYVFDWCIILVLLGVSLYLDKHEPNHHPFSLEDPNISFPFTEHETVPPWLLVTLSAGLPIVVIPIISLIFIPGHTVPPGTPKSLIWKRKLWELHVGWLGFALSIASTWFITNSTKNLLGKPRPDFLARCNPDIANWTDFIVGGVDVGNGFQRLVSAEICQGVEGRDLQDGFRSYPSGHSSSSMAGLGYLSLFIASKFAITFPFLAPGNPALTVAAFPSRSGANAPAAAADEQLHTPNNSAGTRLFSAHNARLASARQQAAAPPLYLLFATLVPFFIAVFISASRWFDFRHAGFDILCGNIIGLTSAFFAFRWYHLPIAQGAGWAWGPRCADKAWWAGVGSFSYAVDWEEETYGDAGWRASGDGGLAMEEGRGQGPKVFSMASASAGSDVHSDMVDRDARRRMT
ncbi:hypothetical protein N0V82_007926 [Gnomoniopsis sp. IMI 355080]|nr:hypothetical protein N0V82_007926 [Gnomoniopsis sp. IMI 355080]